MKPNPAAITRAQELARRNNEAAAVAAAYRRRLGRKRSGKRSARKAEPFNELIWRAAEREAKPVRAVGFFVE